MNIQTQKLSQLIIALAVFLASHHSMAIDISVYCSDLDNISSTTCNQTLPDQQVSGYFNLLRLAADVDTCKSDGNQLECFSSFTGESLTCEINDNSASCNLPDGATASCLEDGSNGINCNIAIPEQEEVSNDLNQLETNVQASLTSTLGRVCTQRSADANLQSDCSTLINLVNSGNSLANQIIEQISPSAAAVPSNIGLFSQAAQVRNVQDRLNQKRKFKTDPDEEISAMKHPLKSANPFKAISFKSTNDDPDHAKLATGLVFALNSLAQAATVTDTPNPSSTHAEIESELITEFSKTGTFFSGVYIQTEKDETNFEIGTETDLAGFTAGIDHQFSDRLLIGLAFGLNQTDTEFAKNRGEIDSTNFTITYYGTFQFDHNIYFDTTLSYGGSHYDQLRKIIYSGSGIAVNQEATADFNGSQSQISITTGWGWSRKNLAINPYIQWRNTDVRVDDYIEAMSNPTGAGSGWGLSLASQSLDSENIRIGSQFTFAISQDWGVLIPTARIEAIKELEDEPRLITGRFTGDRIDQNNFSLATDALDSSYLHLGLGLSAVHTKGFNSFLFFKTISGHQNLSQQEISFGLRWEI